MAGIHLFSKDLRLEDNEALSKLCNKLAIFKEKKAIALFHLDTNQIIKESTKWYRSDNAIRFMLQSLHSLNVSLDKRLHIVYGDRDDLYSYIEKLKRSHSVNYLSKNMDYTKYAIVKHGELTKTCNDLSIEIIEGVQDHTIVDVGLVLKDNKEPYTTFTHFYNKLLKNISLKEVKSKYKCEDVAWCHPEKDYECEHQLSNVCKLLGMNYNELVDKNTWLSKEIIYGGRESAISRLQLLSAPKEKNKTIQRFIERDNMSEDRGLNISAYLNFGCVSSREVVEMFYPVSEELFKQMAWRDFYFCLLRFNKKAREYVWLDERYNKISWRDVKSTSFKEEWQSFIDCRTGCLIVDAAMSELKQTGFMNNRARLLWATFAVKYIQSNPFDKIYGAVSLFSRYLIDCSTSQNKMNFEWIISTLDIGGRRFAKKGESPLSGRVISLDNKHTLKKYNAYEYVRKWLPQYKDINDKELSKIEPVIDLKKRYQQYCDMFKS